MIALARRHWWLVLLWIAGVASVARLTAFMIDPARTAGSIVPDDDFYSHHNCATAYVRAGELAQARVANLYLEQHYWGSRPDDPRASIGPFAVDLYEYPPPFLLPVRAALAVTRDFMTLRVAWFVVELALLLYAGYRLAHWIGGRSGRRIVALAPALIASAPALATLQLGNFQLAAYSLSILAMVAFADRRDALGGALLAFAKIGRAHV